jgi:hypothetical protein
MTTRKRHPPKQLPGIVYNPVTLDPERDIPTFVNEADTKWWAIHAGPRARAYFTRRPPKRDMYIVIVNNEIVYRHQDLQPTLEWLQMLEGFRA